MLSPSPLVDGRVLYGECVWCSLWCLHITHTHTHTHTHTSHRLPWALRFQACSVHKPQGTYTNTLTLYSSSSWCLQSPLKWHTVPTQNIKHHPPCTEHMYPEILLNALELRDSLNSLHVYVMWSMWGFGVCVYSCRVRCMYLSMIVCYTHKRKA